MAARRRPPGGRALGHPGPRQRQQRRRAAQGEDGREHGVGQGDGPRRGLGPQQDPGSRAQAGGAGRRRGWSSRPPPPRGRSAAGPGRSPPTPQPPSRRRPAAGASEGSPPGRRRASARTGRASTATRQQRGGTIRRPSSGRARAARPWASGQPRDAGENGIGGAHQQQSGQQGPPAPAVAGERPPPLARPPWPGQREGPGHRGEGEESPSVEGGGHHLRGRRARFSIQRCSFRRRKPMALIRSSSSPCLYTCTLDCPEVRRR